MPTDTTTSLITLGARLASELTVALIDAFTRGDDLEPLLSALPPEAAKVARRVLEDAETLRQLQAVADRT